MGERMRAPKSTFNPVGGETPDDVLFSWRKLPRAEKIRQRNAIDCWFLNKPFSLDDHKYFVRTAAIDKGLDGPTYWPSQPFLGATDRIVIPCEWLEIPYAFHEVCPLSPGGDLEIVCRRWNYKVHSSVFAAHSTFFDRICNGSFREARTRKVDLSSHDPALIHAMVRFKYNGCYRNEVPLQEYASALGFHAAMFALADEFDFPLLQGYAYLHFKEVLRLRRFAMGELIEMIPSLYALVPSSIDALRKLIVKQVVIDFPLLQQMKYTRNPAPGDEESGVENLAWLVDFANTMLKDACEDCPEFAVDLAMAQAEHYPHMKGSWDLEHSNTVGIVCRCCKSRTSVPKPATAWRPGKWDIDSTRRDTEIFCEECLLRITWLDWVRLLHAKKRRHYFCVHLAVSHLPPYAEWQTLDDGWAHADTCADHVDEESCWHILMQAEKNEERKISEIMQFTDTTKESDIPFYWGFFTQFTCRWKLKPKLESSPILGR